MQTSLKICFKEKKRSISIKRYRIFHKILLLLFYFLIFFFIFSIYINFNQLSDFLKQLITNLIVICADKIIESMIKTCNSPVLQHPNFYRLSSLVSLSFFLLAMICSLVLRPKRDSLRNFASTWESLLFSTVLMAISAWRHRCRYRGTKNLRAIYHKIHS